MRYIHQHENWPLFTWDSGHLAAVLAETRFQQGLLLGGMLTLDPASAQEAEKAVLLADAFYTRALEEVHGSKEARTKEADSSRQNARSPEETPDRPSLAEAGRPDGKKKRPARPARPALSGQTVENARHSPEYVMLREILSDSAKLLTAARLDEWSRLLSPNNGAPQGMRGDADGPKHIIYGPLGWERVQFEAPDPARLPEEMRAFLAWYNFGKIPRPEREAPLSANRPLSASRRAGERESADGQSVSLLLEDAVIRSGIAHSPVQRRLSAHRQSPGRSTAAPGRCRKQTLLQFVRTDLP